MYHCSIYVSFFYNFITFIQITKIFYNKTNMLSIIIKYLIKIISFFQKFYDKTGVRILTMCPSFTSTPIVTFQKENIFHDVIDDDFFKNNLPRQFYTPQS